MAEPKLGADLDPRGLKWFLRKAKLRNLEARKAFWSASLQATGFFWSLDDHQIQQGPGSFPTKNFWYKKTLV
jgi:hypothetical protein